MTKGERNVIKYRLYELYKALAYHTERLENSTDKESKELELTQCLELTTEIRIITTLARDLNIPQVIQAAQDEAKEDRVA